MNGPRSHDARIAAPGLILAEQLDAVQRAPAAIWPATRQPVLLVGHARFQALLSSHTSPMLLPGVIQLTRVSRAFVPWSKL